MKIFLSLLCIVFTIQFKALSQPTPGGIAFVAINVDGSSDNFSFLLLQEAPDGTTIFFDENEWDGSAMNSGEGIIEWSNNAGSTLSAGTVITVSGLNSSVSASAGAASVLAGTFNLGGTDEAIYAYLGSSGNPSIFLAAIANDDFGSAGGTLTGTGLTAGVTASELDNIDSDADVANYIGSTDCTGQSLIACATMFNTVNGTNWESFDDTGDQSGNFNPIASATVPGTYGALPIELLHFEVIRIETGIGVYWTTSTEINNDYMAVERSNDGRNFIEIGRIQGAGTTEIAQDYQFIDEQPRAGLNYYRLRQVDFDGQYEYHQTVAVEFNNTIADVVYVYPTNTKEILQVMIPDNITEGASLQVISVDGRIWSQTILQEKTIQMELSVINLPAGSYWLKVIDRQSTQQAYFQKG